jgi:hypothetical protein
MTLERTPQGQFVPDETPDFNKPGLRDPLAPWETWLGDPKDRYGQHMPAADVPVKTLLKMLPTPVIALASSFLCALTIRAKYVIESDDPVKQRFFQEMYNAVHWEFMLQSLPALLIGYQGLVKQFELVAPDRFAAWPSDVRPLAITGFEQIHPTIGEPTFEKRRFTGITLSDKTLVPPFYALWLTRAKHLAFGDYRGWGRLRNAYSDWWHKQFARDLYLVYLQKAVQPTPVMDYPPGSTDGKQHREVAKAVAEAHLAGAPVTLPSDTYTFRDEHNQDRYSNIRKWALRYIQSGGDIGEFHRIDDQHDAQMAMGLLVPPQAIIKAQMTSLSGTSTTEVLGELTEDVLILDIAEIDRHINDYLFPILDRANFPPGGKPVRKRTVGLDQQDREKLWEVLIALLGKAEGTGGVNLAALLDRLDVPRREQAPTGGEAEAFTFSRTDDAMREHDAHIQEAHDTYLRELTDAKRALPEDDVFGEDDE